MSNSNRICGDCEYFGDYDDFTEKGLQKGAECNYNRLHGAKAAPERTRARLVGCSQWKQRTWEYPEKCTQCSRWAKTDKGNYRCGSPCGIKKNGAACRNGRIYKRRQDESNKQTTLF